MRVAAHLTAAGRWEEEANGTCLNKQGALTLGGAGVVLAWAVSWRSESSSYSAPPATVARAPRLLNSPTPCLPCAITP